MVAPVQPTPEEAIPLTDDTDPMDVPFGRDLPVEVGYGDGDENTFYAERQALLWSEGGDPRGQDGYTAALDGLTQQMDVMDRVLSEQELALSSSNILNERRQQAVNLAAQTGGEGAEAVIMQAIEANQLTEDAALAEPKQATSFAAAAVLNPELDDPTLRAVAFRDSQLGSIAKRTADRRVISWGTDNFIADFGALLITPGRILFAQSKFPEAYYERLTEWNKLTVAERSATWPELEQDLWDAAGDNAAVYSSLVMPFVNTDDEIWAKIDSGIDVADTFALIFGVARAASAQKRLSAMTRLRSLALSAGNHRLAGEDTVRGISRGETTGVIEGHPVGVPDSTTTIPEVQAGLEVPTTSHLVNDLVDRGVVPDAPTDIPVENVPMLFDSEKAEAIARARTQIGTKGNILRVEEDEAGFDVVIEAPSIENLTVGDARKALVTVEEDLSLARSSLKDLVDNTDVGDATGEIAFLNNQIEGLKARRKALRDGITHAKKLEGTGLRVSTIRVPGETPTENKIRFTWTVDDTGLLAFKEDQIGTLATLAGSQELRADNVMEGLVGLGSFISNQQRRLYGQVSRQIKEIESVLRSSPIRRLMKRDEQQRVSAVLLKGDKEQTVFSEVQLAQGIETPELGLIKLNEGEILAYKAMRRVFNDLWRMLNKVQRDELINAGFSGLRVNHVGQDGVVRPVTVFAKARHEDIASAIPRIGDSDITHALDARTGNVVDLRTVSNLRNDLNASRKGFIELKEDFINGDGTHYRHVLTDISHVGDLKQARHTFEVPHRVLDFRVGYVPKVVADRIGFVVEELGDVVRNGVKIRDVKAYRGFKTRAEADIYIQRQSLQSSDKTFRVQSMDGTEFKRTNPEGSDFVSQSLFRGAFAGNRTDGVFKIGLDGHEGGRMSAFEAVRRYADYVGRYAPMHSFKQAMIRRFMKSVERHDGQGRALDTAYDWTSDISLSRSDPRYRSAKAVQDWMKTVFAVPTNEERWFQNITQTLGYALDRAIWNKMTGKKRFGAGFAEWAQEKLLTSPWAKDPFQQFKAVTFDMMLGMFNPAQLIVQSAGMAVPLSLHPIEAAAAMPKFLALRNLFRVKKADDAAEMAKLMGQKPAEFKTMWQGFLRSGFADSILENADFGHYVSSAHGYYSPGFLRTVREKGRFFYNMGELNTRTLAWTMAYERLVKKGKWNRTKELTGKQLLEVNNEALRLSMNMMSANRAAWQQGVAALPTQFMQVTARYYENLLAGLFNLKKGGKWTRAEAATSAGISTLLFGAANWSIDELAGDFESWLVDEGEFGLGLDPVKDADTIAAARGGLVEMLSHETLGFALDISDRISLGSGINMVYENLVKPVNMWLFEGDASQMASALIGASGTVGTRMHKAAANLWTLFRGDILRGEIDTATASGIAMDLARITSTGSNAIKAHTWSALNEIINDRTGEPFGLAPPDENPALIYAKAIGFDPLDLEKYYILDQKSKEYQRMVKEISQLAAAEYRQLYTSGEVVDPLVRDRLRRNMAVHLSQLPASVRAEIMTNMEKLWVENDKIEDLQKALFDQLMEADSSTEGREAADIAILEAIKRNPSRAD